MEFVKDEKLSEDGKGKRERAHHDDDRDNAPNEAADVKDDDADDTHDDVPHEKNHNGKESNEKREVMMQPSSNGP